MLYPVQCTCGRAIGDLADAFKLLRYRKIQKIMDDTDRVINPHVLAMVDDLQPDLGDILDQLGLHIECCRTKMMTTVEFWELY